MSCLRAILVVCVPLSWIAIACGQMPPGPPDMSRPEGGRPSFEHGPPAQMPLFMLVMQKSVQADLKLDQKQKQQIQAMTAKMKETMRGRMPPPPDSRDGSAGREPPDGFPGGPGGGPGGPEPPDSSDKDARPEPPGPPDGDARPEPPDSSDKDARPKPPESSDKDARPKPPGSSGKGSRPKPPGEEMEKELSKILTENQLARLKQIAVQLEGPRALLSAERIKKLELTEEQVKKIKRLTRKDEKSLNAILTEEQQAKWQELIGKPFRGKIAFPSPRMPQPRN
jgi:hypothetical protein